MTREEAQAAVAVAEAERQQLLTGLDSVKTEADLAQWRRSVEAANKVLADALDVYRRLGGGMHEEGV